MLIKFLENTQILLEERRSDLIKTIGSGAVSTMEEYKFMTGKIKGLEASQNVLQEIYDSLVKQMKVD